MMNLITEHIATWTGAEIPKANGGRGRGRGANGKSPHGIKKLRELILELAVRGKLVPQDPKNEPASVLLEKIAKEKARLIKEGKIKKQMPLPKISEDEKPFELPNGWEWARLGDIAFCQAGFAFKSRFFNEIGEGLPLIRIRDVGQPFTGTFYFGEYREEFLVNLGDYLISMDGQFRVAPWANDLALLNQRVARLIFFDEGVGKRFIAESLQARLLDLQGVKAYTTVDHLSGKQISESIIAFPPLAEQHRIVAKVDELMALCDKLEQQQTDSNETHQALVETLLAAFTAVADPAEFALSWQRIADHFDTLFTTEESIDQLKQTILQLAVMGKLVPQDPNDEPASVLLEKIAKEKARLIKEGRIKKQKKLPEISKDEEPFDLPDDWEWVAMQEASQPDQIITYGILKPEWVDSGVPTVRVTEMKTGTIDVDSLPKCDSARAAKFEKTTLAVGDLLISKDGTIGKTAFVPKGLEGGNITQHVIRFPINKYLDRHFVRKCIDAPFCQKWLSGETKGVALKGVNVSDFQRIPLPIPPLAEQHRIVAKVDELMAFCDTLKERLRNAQITQIQLADVIVEQAVA